MKKILIIEDDTSLLKAYQEMFKLEGILVIGATTAQEGLTLVQSEKPDLIILDIMLPGGKNGFDVLEELKKNPATQKIPVVISTNLDSEEKVAREIGVCDYIVKANTTKDEVMKLVMNCLKTS
jgi:two-component system alkaline phosphatase synthesis response regulator PhoP